MRMIGRPPLPNAIEYLIECVEDHRTWTPRWADQLVAEIHELQTENQRLRAENESLRQAAPTPGRTPLEVEL
ncbi:MAG: hypothetical protein GHCLOJNM_03031 [bacterium]|nr:hypothetical protein [bacterium]